jgi:hypothetical protein
LELIVLTVATLLGTLLALEAKAWMPHLGRWLVARAIARFPSEIDPSVRQRWEQEIRVDFAEFSDRPLGGLLFASRVLLKGGRDLAAELALEEKLAQGQETRAAVAVPASGFLADVEGLMEPLFEYFMAVGVPTTDRAQSFAARVLNEELADAFDADAARDLQLKLAAGFEANATRFAGRIADQASAQDLQNFAARLRDSGEGDHG